MEFEAPSQMGQRDKAVKSPEKPSKNATETLAVHRRPMAIGVPESSPFFSHREPSKPSLLSSCEYIFGRKL